MRAAVYWRYSKNEQSVYSDAAQVRGCKECAAARELTVVGVYGDPGKSGKKIRNRPGFRQMMADGIAGQFDVVLVHKLDRYSRNLVDIFTTLDELSKANVTLVSVTESAFDFTTPQGRLFLGMLALFAQWYVENLAQETRKGKKERAQQGGWNGALPFGYTTPKAIRQRIEEKVPNARELQAYLETLDYDRETDAVFDLHDIEGYRLMVELYKTGSYSDRDIAEALNKEGYRTSGHWGSRPFSKDTVTPILRNRFYAGWVQYKGEWMEGRHPAAITHEEWRELQAVRRQRACSRQTTKSTDRIYPFRKKVRCAGCGTPMRGHSARGKRYYRDPAHDYGVECTQKTTTPALEVEDQLGEFLASFHLPEDWREQVLRLAEEKAGVPDPDKEKRARLESRLENLKQLFEWGDIERKEYVTKRDDIKAELAKLCSPNDATFDLDRAAELLDDMEALWSLATDRERLKLTETMVDAIGIKGQRIAELKLKPVFCLPRQAA